VIISHQKSYGWLLGHMISSTNDFEHVSSDQAVAVTPCRGSDRRLQFHKRRQFLIRPHNKASAVLTLCGHNPKLSALAIRT
jgi:hypothetical protein